MNSKLSKPEMISGGSKMKANGLAKLLAVMLIATPAIVSASTQGERNHLEKISVSKLGSDTVVKFQLDKKIGKLPKSFKTKNSTKIVVDFENSTNSSGRGQRPKFDRDIESIHVGETYSKTRAVLSLKNDVSYDLRIDGKTLVMTLRPQTEIAVPVSKTSNVASNSVKVVDFKRGANGEGNVIVDLANSSGTIDIKRHGQSLVLEFVDVSLPEALRKRLNVVEFGTPIQSITSTMQSGKSRVVIEQKGPWEYVAYQANSKMIVEVKENKSEQKAAQVSRYKGEKLSLNFQNIEIKSLLNVLADHTKINIIASDTVRGSITLLLKDVPWDQVLDIVLQTGNLDMRRNGDVIMIAPREEIAKREKDMIDVAAQMSESEPLKTESFQLNYTSTGEMLAVITNEKQRILSKRGSAVVDERTNQIFVQDIPDRLAEVAKIIKKIDIAMRQVQIEARIVEAGDKFSQSIGARLGFNSAAPFGVGSGKAIVGAGLGSTAYQSGQLPTNGNLLTDGMSVNLPAISSNGAAAGKYSMVLFNNAATRFLNLELSALEADGRGKIISSPRVVTADQETALIEQGVELPYQEASSSGAATVSFRKANLRLEVKPHITPDGNIIMSVEINKDAPGIATTSGIAIDTKHIKAKVMIENGGTVVIGGIYTQDERTDVNKIPLLGDLPFAGALFRNKVKQDTKTELLFFLTPRILDEKLTSLN